MIEQCIRRTLAVNSPLGGVGRAGILPTSEELSESVQGRLTRLAPEILMWLLSLLSVLALGLLLSSPTPSYANKKAGSERIHLVDINHASVEELATLPGIGKVTARRIVEFREKNGPFRRLEDLLIIRGISEKRLQQILPRMSLGPDPGKPQKTK